MKRLITAISLIALFGCNNSNKYTMRLSEGAAIVMDTHTGDTWILRKDSGKVKWLYMGKPEK